MTENYIYRPDEDGLGLTAKHYRLIKPGNQYDRYFPRPSNENIFIGDRSTFQALDEIKTIVAETQYQTKAISEVLYDSDPYKFCKNVWDFMYTHYQYKLDAKGKEELREPARAWADRKTGIDCDCYAITALSILINGGLSPLARIVELSNKGYYQHIYVIVPKQKNADLNPWTSNDRYWTIDPVLDSFNLEPEKITYYKDFTMANTYRLAGPDNYNDNNDSELGCACQDANPPMNIGDLGKVKPFKKAIASAKKVVVKTANAGKVVAMKLPAKAVATTKQAVASLPKKPLQRIATAGQKVVVNTASAGKVVAMKLPAKAVATTKQAVASLPKKPLQRPATTGQKVVIKTPNGGQAVVMKVQPKIAPSSQIQEDQKNALRDKIALAMNVRPTPEQKLFFNKQFSLTDTIRINNIVPTAIRHGEDKLGPQERTLFQRAYFALTGNLAKNNTPTPAPKPAPTIKVASFTSNSAPTRLPASSFVDTTMPQTSNNSGQDSPIPQAAIDPNMVIEQAAIDPNYGFEQAAIAPVAPAKKESNGVKYAIAALTLLGISWAATRSKKSKPLNGLEDTLDVEHEVIETKPLNGPSKTKKGKTISQYKIK